MKHVITCHDYCRDIVTFSHCAGQYISPKRSTLLVKFIAWAVLGGVNGRDDTFGFLKESCNETERLYLLCSLLFLQGPSKTLTGCKYSTDVGDGV